MSGLADKSLMCNIQVAVYHLKANGVFTETLISHINLDADINGEPALLIHHGIVRRWRCGSLVTQRPLSLLLSMTYQFLLSMK